MQHPERTTVTHFFAPAWRNPAVEVITWAKSDPALIDYLRWMFAVTGKAPVVTADVIAFMLDRIFDNWTGESAYLLDKAIVKQVDHVAEEFAAVGPFFVLNMSNGNPITHEANTRQAEESDAYLPSDIFLSVDRWNTAKPGTKVEMSDETRSAVRDRLLGIVFSQSLDMVKREIGTPEDLNLGCTLALGFKKGPIDMMADMGEDEVTRILTRLDEERPGLPALDVAPYFGEAVACKRHVLVDQAGRRGGHHHPPPGAAERHDRRGQRRDHGRHPGVRGRPVGGRLRHHRVRHQGLLRRRRDRQVHRDAGRLRPLRRSTRGSRPSSSSTWTR